MKQENTTLSDLSNNLIAQMFDLQKVKELISSCAENEVVILCPNWSISLEDRGNGIWNSMYDECDNKKVKEFINKSLSFLTTKK